VPVHGVGCGFGQQTKSGDKTHVGHHWLSTLTLGVCLCRAGRHHLPKASHGIIQSSEQSSNQSCR
jgi:hypothetical protein